MGKSRGPDTDKARKTLYVTGFDPKQTNKPLLDELFTQGGPVKDITLFETHAYVLFEHEDSVAYCLALFSDIELYGRKLRLSPRYKSDDSYSYLKYLKIVRDKLMSQYAKIPPPNLPSRIMPLSSKKENNNKGSVRRSRMSTSSNRERRKSEKSTPSSKSTMNSEANNDNNNNHKSNSGTINKNNNGKRRVKRHKHRPRGKKSVRLQRTS